MPSWVTLIRFGLEALPALLGGVDGFFKPLNFLGYTNYIFCDS